MTLRMLKWHLIGKQRENYPGFVNVGGKYRSFANAYGDYEKMQHYVLRLRHSRAKSFSALRWQRFTRQIQDHRQRPGVKVLFAPQRCYRKTDLKEAATPPSTAEGWKTHRLSWPG